MAEWSFRFIPIIVVQVVHVFSEFFQSLVQYNTLCRCALKSVSRYFPYCVRESDCLRDSLPLHDSCHAPVELRFRSKESNIRLSTLCIYLVHDHIHQCYLVAFSETTILLPQSEGPTCNHYVYSVCAFVLSTPPIPSISSAS